MKIDSYSFGSMTIDGKIYNADVIIFPEKVSPSWWRKEGHSLAIEDLEEILKYKPEVLVVGRGYSSQMRIPPETRRILQYKNIRVIDTETGKAYPIFNDEIAKGTKVVGAFHLTC